MKKDIGNWLAIVAAVIIGNIIVGLFIKFQYIDPLQDKVAKNPLFNLLGV